ncbi:MAG: ABC transporter substrate-binding protein [Nitrososphaerales archaeon]
MPSATVKLLIGLVAVIGIIATTLILSQAAVFQPANRPIESMTFLTDFGVTPKSMPFFVSQERGYFEDAGVSPTFLEGRGSNFAMTQLDAGQADMAIVDASTLIARIEEGAKVKAVMVLLSKPQIVLNVLRESGIEDLEDLEGRRIGDVRGSTLQNLLPVAMLNNGLNPDLVSYTFVDRSVLTVGFLNGQFDAVISTYPSIPEQEGYAAEQGKEMNSILLGDYLDLYGSVIAANTDFLEQRPDVARGFLKGFIAGLQDSIQDPETAFEIMSKYHPELSDEDLVLQFRRATHLMDIDAVLSGQLGFDEDYFLLNLETIGTALGAPLQMAPSTFFTNEFLK